MFDPYGKVTVLDGNAQNTRTESLYGNTRFHQGLRLDTETGLYYNRYRMLDPVLGRFIGRDPWSMRKDGPSAGDGFGGSLSRYAYVAGRPAIYLDPTGLLPTVCNCWYLETQLLYGWTYRTIEVGPFVYPAPIQNPPPAPPAVRIWPPSGKPDVIPATIQESDLLMPSGFFTYDLIAIRGRACRTPGSKPTNGNEEAEIRFYDPAADPYVVGVNGEQPSFPDSLSVKKKQYSGELRRSLVMAPRAALNVPTNVSGQPTARSLLPNPKSPIEAAVMKEVLKSIPGSPGKCGLWVTFPIDSRSRRFSGPGRIEMWIRDADGQESHCDTYNYSR